MAPQVIADQNGFQIIYLQLSSENLRKTFERQLAQRLIKENPAMRGLLVVSDVQQKHWHLVNIKFNRNENNGGQMVLRRMRIGPSQPVRTAVERLVEVDIECVGEEKSAADLQDLHDKAFDVESVTKQFFGDIANWYFWALQHSKFPKDSPKETDGRDHIGLIRLITRLIFCWFIREKGLIPDALFDRRELDGILKEFDPDKAKTKNSVYYRAILQNLFFATLSTEQDDRKWAGDQQNFMAHSLYRFKEYFQNPSSALGLFKSIPFLNGGLFECLDRDLGEGHSPRYIRIDGFSRRADSQPVVPDFLFFGPEKEIDLSAEYGNPRFRSVRVRGIINTLRQYNFTIEENTPIEEEVALDPELCGKVFENLLAAYNPETGTTARKQSGSFYTPREIVNYMVDEALIASLSTKLEAAVSAAKDIEPRLRHLFAYNDEPHQFEKKEVKALITAIDSLKTLDPAVGSGAFPMGLLHKLVFILGKLDPRNEQWKERQIARVRDAIKTAEKIEDDTVRSRAIEDLEAQIANVEESFARNELDYGRKLYLIENCIYGVDIQPIAVQIAKMRFFISLIVDQKIDDSLPNRGVRPLPNLETKFVAANTLIAIERPGQQLLRNRDIDAKESDLRRVRERHFLARTPKQKAKCREEDSRLRIQISELLKGDGWDNLTARKLALWNPYDQNDSADFFDTEWMFGMTDGFDVVIGNPPYRMLQPHNTSQSELDYFRRNYVAADFKIELFHLFLQRGTSLLPASGCLGFIVPTTLLNNVYAEKLRQWIMGRCAIKTIAISPIHVFAEADVHTSVVILTRETNAQNRAANLVATTTDLTSEFAASPGDYASTLQSRFTALPGCVWNVLLNEENAGLIEKIRKAGKPLEIVAKINRGLITGNRKQFFSEKKLTKNHVSILTGADVKRYSTKAPNEYVLFERPKSAGGCWDKDVHLADHKVVVRQIGAKPTASFIGKPIAVTGNIFTIRGKSEEHEKLILGIVNSTLIEFFWRILFSDFKSTFPQVTIFSLAQVPVSDASTACKGFDSTQRTVIRLVDEILAVKRADAEADTSALEREIDQQLYALYGLTPEDIKIIEGVKA